MANFNFLNSIVDNKASNLMRTYRFLTFTIISSGYLAKIFLDTVSNDPVPMIQDEMWGPGSYPGLLSKSAEDDSITPFAVDISSPEIVNELRVKLTSELKSGRLTPPLEGTAFTYGFNTNYLKEVLTYWLERYDFGERERYLNKYPHFKTKIGGLNIHFQHIKPDPNAKYKKTVPIIFCHGWPGSFAEHQKIIPMFLEPEDSEINFEIVIPSLPGFGFSEGPSRPGMDTVRMANIYGRLMDRLGYQKYYTMGEDWGSAVSTDLAMLYPNRVKGTHFECFSFHPLDSVKQGIASVMSPEKLFPNKRQRERLIGPKTGMLKALGYLIREFGYFHLQATKPDTVGVALGQSPSGLAAYILEKFSTWTNETNIMKEDGGLTDKFSMDELLDNLMIYWVTNSITTSMRIYSMSLTQDSWHAWKVPVTNPVACTLTPEDCIFAGNGGFSTKFPNLKQFTPTEDGGHFGIFEVPHLIAPAALKFFNNIEFDRYKEKEGVNGFRWTFNSGLPSFPILPNIIADLFERASVPSIPNLPNLPNAPNFPDLSNLIRNIPNSANFGENANLRSIPNFPNLADIRNTIFASIPNITNIPPIPSIPNIPTAFLSTPTP